MCSSLTMLDSSPGHVPGQVGDFRLIKPELMPGVPLVLDRILKEVYRKLETRGPLAVPLFNYFLDYKIRWKGRGFDSPLLNRLLSDRVKTQFAGGKQLVSMFVGSAPLSERTQALIQETFNVKMMQAYGSTEMTGACHITNNNSLTYGHCGVPLHSNRFYLEDWEEGGYSANDKPNPRGEVVVGGENISLGYYKMPQETEEAFFVDEQGTRWFRSGDIAELLPDGNLKIIDRRKDLMKLANGRSGLRSSSPYVENICVCTNTNSNYVTAIISPNRKAMDELVKKLDLPSSLSLEQLCNHPAVVDHIKTDIEETCTELSFAKKEMPAEITLVAEEWTPDNFLTAALKMRRKPVNEFYQEAIRNMFAETK
ncbi:Long-chain-fatty-acid--CoA ligase 4 [Tyrophagus putrescentiae]|nr:Long-chain-fatty-acid--CoA ligase 4 [Tyrophagus putrescentiae]